MSISGNKAVWRTIRDKFLFKTLVFQQNQAFSQFAHSNVQKNKFKMQYTGNICFLVQYAGNICFFSHRNSGKICLFELKNAGIRPNDLIFICLFCFKNLVDTLEEYHRLIE